MRCQDVLARGGNGTRERCVWIALLRCGMLLPSFMLIAMAVLGARLLSLSWHGTASLCGSGAEDLPIVATLTDPK